MHIVLCALLAATSAAVQLADECTSHGHLYAQRGKRSTNTLSNKDEDCKTTTTKTPPPSPHTKPNILIILADDVGIGDITAYDPTAPVPTPNIDALAAAGTILHDAHAQVVCAPSRASLLAGRHPYENEWNYGSGSSVKASRKRTPAVQPA